VFKIQRGCLLYNKKNSDGCNERTWSSSGRKGAEWLVVKLVNYMMTMREKEIDIERERESSGFVL